MKKVIAYVHSHWDREWYRDFEDFRLRLIEVMDKIIDGLDSNEIPVFYFDGQTAAIEDYLEIYPEKKDKIKKLIRDKKLYIGPFYCSTDSFLTSAESMIRNLCMGIKKSKEFSCNDYIGYLSDTFGHSPSIAYVLKYFGIDKIMLWRGLGNLPADIKWEGIDTTYLIQGYYQDFLNMSIYIDNKAEALKKYLDKISEKSTDTLLLAVGGDHLAPPDKLLKQIELLNKYYEDYKIEIGTPFDYFKAVKDVEREEVYSEFLDNSLNFILPGVYSARIYLKQENAIAQWQLSRVSEPLQALSKFLYGVDSRQKQIDYAYRLLIKNQAHDSIYGCSLDEVHDEVMTRYKKIQSVSDGVLKRCVRDLSNRSTEISVINLSNYSYSGAIKIKTGKILDEKYNAVLINTEKGFTDEKLYNINEVPLTEDYTDIYEYLIDIQDVNSFSISEINDENICKTKHLKTYSGSIENDFIKFEVTSKKVQLTDKINNEIYFDVLKFTDRADIGDSYNFGALPGDKAIESQIKSWSLKESNHIRAVLNIEFDMKIPQGSTKKGRSKKTYTHTIDVDAILYNQSKQIEFIINYQNKSKNHILQADFKLKKPVEETISEDALGLIRREFNPNYDVYKYIPAQRGIELKTNTAPIQRFIWAQNVGIITEGLNEYEVFKNNLKITLLRAAGVISNPENSMRGTPAGPPLETPGLQCLGENKARFAITFCENPVELYKLSEEFYGAIVPFWSAENNVQILNINNNNILVNAIKLEENNLIVRLVNISTQEQECEITSDLKIKKIIEISPLEEDIRVIKEPVIFKPKEIKTIKIAKV